MTGAYGIRDNEDAFVNKLESKGFNASTKNLLM